MVNPFSVFQVRMTKMKFLNSERRASIGAAMRRLSLRRQSTLASGRRKSSVIKSFGKYFNRATK